MKHLMLSFCLALISLVSKGQSSNTPVYKGTTSLDMGFYQYLPDGYNTELNKTFPVLIFLHGIDEKGNGTTELSRVEKHGPPKLISQNQDFPFIVISPQNVGGFFSPEQTRNLIKYVKDNYRADLSKIYLTGISAGAMSVWNYLGKYSSDNDVAAVVTIAGNANSLRDEACKFKNIPIWTFHGEDDNIVNVGGSVNIVNAINNCEPKPKVPAKSTVYPNTGHDSWTKTFNKSAGYDIFSWLLKYSNPAYSNWKTKQSSRTSGTRTIVNKGCELVTPLPKALLEISGIEVYNNYFWGHNDSGNRPYIFKFDSAGKIISLHKILNAANYDWEDITQDKDHFYIADIGNNTNSRKDFQIYIINKDDLNNERISASKINFTIPDQKTFPATEQESNFDFESAVFLNDSIYIFSKNRTNPFNGECVSYQIPAKAGTYEAVKKDSIYLGKGNMIQFWVTAAALSPSNKKLALLSSDKLWIFQNFKGSDFFQGDIIQINLSTITQKEAISFADEETIYIGDENFRNINGGNLYVLKLTE
ncbi:hypothetical protein [Fulvivirga ligni]|uniref:hypothetical protein n=1 Tax=Fulvivirga ligni TaxID=2904246 RepID=UPI001F3C566A|nr:hypothetical protein [Fulvivirga ligni]UII19711.1 hypothetical protein LVD16_17865 [Fulvivirga ligni]